MEISEAEFKAVKNDAIIACDQIALLLKAMHSAYDLEARTALSTRMLILQLASVMRKLRT